MDSETAKQLQVRLVTTQENIAVPSLTLSVPAGIDPDGLNKLVHGLLREDRGAEYDGDGLTGKVFQFVVLEDFLRGTLGDFVADKDHVSTESVLDIHYLESATAPEPGKSSNHDDWVAGVSARGGYVLTACYDNTINIFAANDGEKKLTIPGHSGPARDVVWISLDETSGTFASCAHDQVVMLYHWDIASNAIEAMNACKGHERSVDCLDVNPSGTMLASGSFDNTLKIWGAKMQGGGNGVEGGGGEESDRKKARGNDGQRTLTRTPIMTLAGHKEGVSGVAWMENNELATASWDHTIKLWDVELGGMKSELVGNKSFFSLSYSPLNHSIITASADSAIRLYDPRAKDGVIVKSQYTSHHGWVTSVFWSKVKEHLFVSGGHDCLVKLWDSRSYKTPLYDLKGHQDKVLCCDWSQSDYVCSGGADNTLKIFKTND